MAIPASVAVLTPMELIALIRLPDSPSLQALLDAEEEGHTLRTRSRDFGMEFVRDAAGALTPAIVTMLVVAPDFDPPHLQKTVRIRPDSDSERQSFLLTPQRAGSLRIQFDIVAGELTLASRSLQTIAEPGDRVTPGARPVVVSVPLRVNVVRRALWKRITMAASLIVAVAAAAVLSGQLVTGPRPSDGELNGLTDTSPRGLTPVPAAPARAVDGPAYALIIGNKDYTELPALTTTMSDAADVEAILRLNYGFNTRLLSNAKRYELVSALNAYRSSLPANASLLIYYAGHGYYDAAADKAYWLPIDAQRDNSANWIIADDITSIVRALPARKVLVVADSCYSGGLTRGAEVAFTPQERDRYLEKMSAGRSRTLLASGGNEPVADGGGDGTHSVFASALLRGLRTMQPQRFTAEELFSTHIRVPVAGRSQQTPQYMPIRNSGHEDGDFVFVRKP